MTESVYEPRFKGPIEGYVRNQLKRHLWRVNRHREYEDMMQEAHCVFYHLKNRYAEVEGMNDPWFMALFVRSFTNVITNISLRDSRNSVEHLAGVFIDEEGNIEECGLENLMNAMGDPDNEGYYRIYLKQAPSELRSVLSILFNAPQDMLDDVAAAFKTRGDNYGNKMLCGLVGLDPKHWDLKFMLKEYIKPGMSD